MLLDSVFDTIELTHRARTRGGLALGAVRAAEWLAGKRGLFEVNDFIQSLLQEEHEMKLDGVIHGSRHADER